MLFELCNVTMEQKLFSIWSNVTTTHCLKSIEMACTNVGVGACVRRFLCVFLSFVARRKHSQDQSSLQFINRPPRKLPSRLRAVPLCFSITWTASWCAARIILFRIRFTSPIVHITAHCVITFVLIHFIDIGCCEKEWKLCFSFLSKYLFAF